MKAIKYAERGLTAMAGGLFNAIQVVNKYKPNPSFTPKWSEKPLLKSWQKTKPTLGWPRVTDSLCPNCVVAAEIRQDHRQIFKALACWIDIHLVMQFALCQLIKSNVSIQGWQFAVPGV